MKSLPVVLVVVLPLSGCGVFNRAGLSPSGMGVAGSTIEDATISSLQIVTKPSGKRHIQGVVSTTVFSGKARVQVSVIDKAGAVFGWQVKDVVITRGTPVKFEMEAFPRAASVATDKVTVIAKNP